MTDQPSGFVVTGLPVPRGAGDIDAGWLSEVLRRPVVGVRLTRIGETQGFTGAQVHRLHVAGSPESLVAKLGAPEMAGANAREIAAYRALQDAPEMPVPQCHHAACDPASGASVLILQDLSACRAGDFAQGCAAADARQTATAIGKMHARFRNAPVRDSGAPMFGADLAALWAAYPARLAAILPEVTLPARLRALGDWLAQDGAAFFAALARRPDATRLHGDLQLDNVLFCPDRGAMLIDWHFSAMGPGGLDLGYFLVSSLSPAARRDVQGDIVAAYRQAAGLPDGDTLDGDILAAAALKLAMTVMATVQFTHDTDQRRGWRHTDLQRLVAFLEDHAITPDAFA